MKYRIFRPIFLQLLHGKSLEQVFSPREIRIKGTTQQRLAKTPWTTQKHILVFLHHIVYKGCLIHINHPFLHDVAESLHTTWVYSVQFHRPTFSDSYYFLGKINTIIRKYKIFPTTFPTDSQFSPKNALLSYRIHGKIQFHRILSCERQFLVEVPKIGGDLCLVVG